MPLFEASAAAPASRQRAKPQEEETMRTASAGARLLAVSVAAALLASGDALAQAAFPPPPPKVSPAAGVIDMHVHSHPDVFGRNMDDIDVAQLAKARGMRGILLKNHVAETEIGRASCRERV